MILYTTIKSIWNWRVLHLQVTDLADLIATVKSLIAWIESTDEDFNQ